MINKNRKIIWTSYIIGWIYFIFFDSSYSQDDHFFYYFIFGWIPFVILHFLWKNDDVNNNHKTDEVTDDFDDSLQKLEKLKRLREGKLINDEEFFKMKKQIIDRI